MNPLELASEPPQSRIGAASNSAPELRRLGWVMLGHLPYPYWFMLTNMLVISDQGPI